MKELYLQALKSLSSAKEYDVVTLRDFEIYRSDRRKQHAHTLAPLSDLKTARGDSTLVFDGILEVGSESCYVEGVEFEVLSIDGYGDDISSVSDVFIQSQHAARKNVWYRLGNPSKRYQYYHNPFLWLANFAKHFVDFLSCHDNVTTILFRKRFRQCLISNYGGQENFEEWLHVYSGSEFTNAITTNTEFLWKEAVDMDENHRRHFIWSELDPVQLKAIKPQPQQETLTVVTPYIYRCFSNCNFEEHLKVMDFTDDIKQARDARARLMGLTLSLPTSKRGLELTEPENEVLVGDIIAVDRDEQGAWRDDSKLWYAYVQDIKRDNYLEKYLGLIWLYRPTDTICSTAFYPYSNELFMSDHCNCHDSKIRMSDVRFKVKTRLFHSPAGDDSIPFIRQLYITPDEETFKDAAFTTLTHEHLHCSCSDSSASSDLERVKTNFPTGSTVLVKQQRKDLLEPMVIVNVKDESHVRVRQLLRRGKDGKDRFAKPNELLLTKTFFDIDPKRIIRRCHIRRYDKAFISGGCLRPPYCYNGAADCWVVSGELVDYDTIKDYDAVTLSSPAGFEEGFDPISRSATNAMKGMSLFGGWGGLDRGLEEGGAVTFKWIVEWDEKALHSHRANLKDPDNVHLYLGSVNDYLMRALEGHTDSIIAKVGSVMMIVAGCPCKGCSRSQLDKTSERSKRHVSLVASVLAFVDLYCPAYGIIENVFDMSRDSVAGDNVFRSVICALVGKGYQTEVFNLDAWAYGSSQTRSRLFISFTAPGYSPMKIPSQTHTHPPHTCSRKVGSTISGEKYGFRRFEYCPFNFISAEELVKDLPDIRDGNVGICVPFPEHKLPGRQIYEKAAIMQWIPRFPQGCGSHYAYQRGLLSDAVIQNWGKRTAEQLSPASRSYMRMRQERLFPTIRTASYPDDSRHGNCVHWSQNRMMTLQEARRAQSIPDHEILIGSIAQKWEIVGNGVDRKNAVAIGMNLREAWLDKETQRKLAERIISVAHCDGDERVELANSRREHCESTYDLVEADTTRGDGKNFFSQSSDDTSTQGSSKTSNLALRNKVQKFQFVEVPAANRDAERTDSSVSRATNYHYPCRQFQEDALSNESNATRTESDHINETELNRNHQLQNQNAHSRAVGKEPVIQDSQEHGKESDSDSDELSVGECIVLARTGRY